MKTYLAIIIVILSLTAPALAGPAGPLDQKVLDGMTAAQLQAEFDATIQLAREAQNRFHKSRNRRLATAFVPLLGVVGAGETAARVGNLRSYQHKLLQLKRALQYRHPQAWEETKRKWCIGDDYLER